MYKRFTNNSVTECSDINWNFEKFIVSKDGRIIARFLNQIDMTDLTITKLIEQELDTE